MKATRGSFSVADPRFGTRRNGRYSRLFHQKWDPNNWENDRQKIAREKEQDMTKRLRAGIDEFRRLLEEKYQQQRKR